jgi:UDP-glucose 4-epimerase
LAKAWRLLDYDRSVLKSCIVGGAGFIGSHLAHELLRRPNQELVVYDNLASGSTSYLNDFLDDSRLELVVADVQDLDRLVETLRGVDHVYHFAANPDIARAMTDPSVDFWQGTYLTQNVIEAMRINNVPRITYASGSGVYGDRGTEEVDESFGPLVPISTYGASKLSCEVLLAAYTHMFGLHAAVLRFANVVGKRQTHGVTYDFVRRLLADPTRLQILGDGSQSKSYIHVADVVAAMMLLTDQGWDGFEIFNAGTGDYITVTEIADLVVERMALRGVKYEYTGGSRGWKGDVPVVRFRSDKLAARGWRCRRTSREALIESIDANIAEASAAMAR